LSKRRARAKPTAKGKGPKPKTQSPKPEAPPEVRLKPDATPPEPSPASASSSGLKAWRVVNRVQLGELMGLHPDSITDNVRLGMPVITKGGRGLESEYDAVDCLAWYRERQGKNALDKAKTKLTDVNAQRAEINLEKERGLLVSRAEVINAGQTFVKAWTAKLLTMPTRLRHIGAITREQESGVAAFVREILTEISSWKTVGDALDSSAKDSAA